MKKKLPRDPMLDAVPFETNRFMDGKYIPDENMAFVDINRDPKLAKDLYSFYYGSETGTSSGFINPKGTIPILYETIKKFNEEYIDPLKVIKIPGIDKIRWRYRKHESVKSTRWNRNHTKVAEFYWFWEIICRNAKMYIPLEDQFNLQAAFRQTPVPTLVCRLPFPRNES